MIKYDENTKTFSVSYGKRHPITRQPISLRRKGIKSKAEANRVYSELVILADTKIKQKIVPMWPKLIEDFFEMRRQHGLTEHTLHSELGCLKKFTLPRWETRFCDSITRAEIYSLLTEEMSGKADSHRKYVLKCLRAAFAYAVDMGFITSNPTPLLKFKLGEKIRAALTEPQVRTLLEKARSVNSEWYPLWATALYTGMRNGELYALRWDYVDLEAGKIKVCQAWNCRDGFKETKSGHDRIVDISPALKPVLQELYATRFGPFVLPRLHRWDQGEQARELRAFLTALGFPAIRFHDLRATWATLLLSKGIEPIKVMKMGGWRDMKTMMIYIRKAGIDVSGALDNLVLHDHNQRVADVIPIGL